MPALRTFALISSVVLSGSLIAQERFPDVSSIYQSQAWQERLTWSLATIPTLEPTAPSGEAEREFLQQQLLPFLKEQNFIGAEPVLRQYILNEVSQGRQAHPFIVQIAGTVSQQLAANAESDAEKRRFRDQAIRYFEQAINAHGTFLRAHKNLANIYFRAKDEFSDPEQTKLYEDRALQHFAKAIELGDNDPITLGLTGYIYYSRGEHVAAESALRQALIAKPDIIEFREVLMQVLAEQGRYQEALALVDELLAKNPNKASYWKARSSTLIGQEKLEEAATSLEITRMLGEADPPALILIGDLYLNKLMAEDATEAYKDAVRRAEANPGSANASRLVESLLRGIRALNSMEAYDYSTELLDLVDSTYGEGLSREQSLNLLTFRSEINLLEGRIEEAVQNLESILKQDPYNERALMSLARHYAELEPEGDPESDAYALAKRRNEQRAITFFERGQNLDDTKVQRRFLIAEAQLRASRGDYQAAVDLLEDALNIEYSERIQQFLAQIRSAMASRAA